MKHLLDTIINEPKEKGVGTNGGRSRLDYMSDFQEKGDAHGRLARHQYNFRHTARISFQGVSSRPGDVTCDSGHHRDGLHAWPWTCGDRAYGVGSCGFASDRVYRGLHASGCIPAHSDDAAVPVVEIKTGAQLV
jgi:hypothetical protein